MTTCSNGAKGETLLAIACTGPIYMMTCCFCEAHSLNETSKTTTLFILAMFVPFQDIKKEGA